MLRLFDLFSLSRVAGFHRFRDPADHVDFQRAVAHKEGVILCAAQGGQHLIIIKGISAETNQKFSVSRAHLRHTVETPRHKIFRLIRIALLWQFWWIPVHDGCELSEHVCVRLWWIGIVTQGHLND